MIIFWQLEGNFPTAHISRPLHRPLSPFSQHLTLSLSLSQASLPSSLCLHLPLLFSCISLSSSLLAVRIEWRRAPTTCWQSVYSAAISASLPCQQQAITSQITNPDNVIRPSRTHKHTHSVNAHKLNKGTYLDGSQVHCLLTSMVRGVTHKHFGAERNQELILKTAGVSLQIETFHSKDVSG